MGLFTSLKSFDAYPKLHDDLRVRTASGAAVSIVAGLCIAALFFSELSFFLSTEIVDHLFVDVSRGEKLQINFDITFAHIPCSLVNVDAMDVSGAHQLDVSATVSKKELDANGNPLGTEAKPGGLGGTLTEADLKAAKAEAAAAGNNATAVAPVDRTKQPGYCGPCYGAELAAGQCCNSCDDVRRAYRERGWALGETKSFEQCANEVDDHDHSPSTAELDRGDGCQLFGSLQVNKVAGNFHFAPGKSFQHGHMHIHDLAALASRRFNISHRINSLSFGRMYPGIVNPLDNYARAVEDGQGMYMYYVKVVPTEYLYLSGERVQTNQFSVTEHHRRLDGPQASGLPGVFFFYELSPLMVKFTEYRKSLAHFLTQLCAILGGVFTVAGMVDRAIYASVRHMEKKNDMGKLG